MSQFPKKQFPITQRQQQSEILLAQCLIILQCFVVARSSDGGVIMTC